MEGYRNPWNTEKRSFGSFFCFWSVHDNPGTSTYSQRF